MPNRDLKVTLVGEDKTSKAFGSAKHEAEGFGSKIKDTGKELSLAFGAAALGGIFGVGEALIEGAKGAMAYQQVGDQVAQTIKSTGNAAHVTVDGLKSYAEEAEKMSGVDKQLILNGENVMLTFTNVKNAAGEGNDVFTRASESALNLSTTMGIDLVSANKLVGKALNDPIKGLGALSRVGVQFTDQQKAQIKEMVKSHDVMGAQKIILDQLKVKFGGAAEAAGKGLAGSLNRAKHAFETMLQHIASAVMPMLAKLAEFIAGTVIPDIESLANFISRNAGPIKLIAGLIAAVFIPHLIKLGVEAVVSAGKQVWAWVMSSKAAIESVAKTAIAIASTIAGWVLMGAQALAQGIKIAAVWTAQIVASAVSGAASFIVSAARVVGGWVLMGVQSLIQAARMAAAWFIALGPIGWVTAAVIAIVALIITHWKLVVSWTTTAWHAVSSAVSTAWHAVTGAISSAISAVRNAISGAWNWVTSVTASAWRAFSSAVGNGLTTAVDFIRGLPGRILSALGNVGSLLLNVGKDLLSGLWNGIQNAAGWLLDKVGSFFGSLLPGWVRDMLGIHSPSTVFAEMGKFLMLGMAEGIDGQSHSAVLAASNAANAITGAMSLQANAAGMNALALTRPLGAPAGLSSGGSPMMGGRSSVPVVHIENYNEARQPPREIAENLAFMARTR